ncbi:hypothetical protein [Ralstonia sp. ASV6]|uniref:hypothetical protein n=1 Tax=Ralstonia sp. ASV6 TaxID=2795124 RepID=UPI0018EC4ABF|nr:hypothetical protein [Ralstonia sp. ASV6]
MGRILGRVEYGGGTPDRFFIHCDTSGWSIEPLFVDQEQPWVVYDAGGSGALLRAIPQRSTVIRAVRKVLAHGRSFGTSDSVYGNPRFGLATEDRLLWPRSAGFEERSLSLLRADGVLHVAEEGDAGFSGVQDIPLCVQHWIPREDEERISLEEVFGQALQLCPLCEAKLLGTSA